MRKRWKRIVASALTLAMTLSLTPNNFRQSYSDDNSVIVSDVYAQQIDEDSDIFVSETIGEVTEESVTETVTEEITDDITEPEVTDDIVEEDIIEEEEIVLAADAIEVAEGTSIQAAINLIEINSENVNEEGYHVGSIKLAEGASFTENLTIPDKTEIILDLNGATINPVHRTDNVEVNHVLIYGNLTIIDSSADKSGTFDANGETSIRCINVASASKLQLEAANITNYEVNGNGAGIRVEANGEFIMNGGNITNNKSLLYGGGIYIFDTKTVTISGGTVSNNTAKNGAGISIYKSSGYSKTTPFELKDIKVTNNTASNYGAGVYFESFAYAKFNGASEISDNEAGFNGGGIYLNTTSYLELADNAKVNNNSLQITAASSDTNNGNGGGIYFRAATTIEGSSFVMNGGEINGNKSSRYGGGIYFGEAVPTTRNSVIINSGVIAQNTSEQRGGGIYMYYKSDVTMTGGKISENVTGHYGAGIQLDTNNKTNNVTFTMTGGEISKNHFVVTDNIRYGAGVCTYRLGTSSDFGLSTIKLSGGVIKENYDAFRGGGLYVCCGSDMTIDTGTQITDNVLYAKTGTATGGGLYSEGGNGAKFTMTGGEFLRNGTKESLSTVGGGGMYLAGTGTYVISGGKICDNRTYNSDAAGLYAGSTLTLKGDVEIGNNTIAGTANKVGAGVYCNIVTIQDDVWIHDNVTRYRGAGVYANDDITIKGNVLVENNKSLADTGGGVFASSHNLVIEGGTFRNNYANHGGAIAVYNNYSAKITNALIENNTAKSNGGGVYLWGDRTTDVPYAEIGEGTIIRNNTANQGGGIGMGNRNRVILSSGAIVTNNKATTLGGGIWCTNGSYASFGDGSTYGIEIAGGMLKDNDASQGRDIYINDNDPGKDYARPVLKMIKPSTMDEATAKAAWIEENGNTYITAAYDNKTEVSKLTTSKNYRFTFTDVTKVVAVIGTKNYSTVQDAVDAIKKGNASGTIKMVDNSREEVVIPEGLKVTLDLAGYELSGIAGSVIFVSKNADLTVKDSTDTGNYDATGKITDGRGIAKYTADRLGGGVFVEGKFTFESGNITNNAATVGSGVYVHEGAEFIMTGGIISKNHAYDSLAPGSSYAVCVCKNGTTSSGADGGAKFTATGGKIIDNLCKGLYLDGRNSVVSLKNVEISRNNSTGNHGTAIDARYFKTLDIEKCEIKDNISNARGAALATVNGGDITIKDTTITGNTTTNASGGGLYIEGSTVYLKGSTIITDNATTAANGNGGGIDLESGYLYIEKGVKIYSNRAGNQSKDIYIKDNSGIFYSDPNETDKDTRGAEYMGVDGINAWYDATRDEYYVDKVTSGMAANVKPLTDMFRTNEKANGTRYLEASSISADPVAKIGTETFPSLASAVGKANSMKGDVKIELLKDITESVVFNDADTKITLDLCGHTITAPEKSSCILNLLADSNLTLVDSQSKGALIPMAGTDISGTRAVLITGGCFTLEDGVTIKDFNVIGNGGAISLASGTTASPSKLYVNGGTFTNCTATNGGAIYCAAAKNVATEVYINGGTFKANNAITDGGAIYYATAGGTLGTFYITGGLFDGNISDYDNDTSGYGGAIRYSGSNSNNMGDEKLALYGAEFVNNKSARAGAFYYNYAGTEANPFMLGSDDSSIETKIHNNETTLFECGGFYIDNSSTTHPTYVVMQNVEIYDNYAKGDRGGCYIGVGSLVAANCNIHDNVSETQYGGAQINIAKLDMHDCIIKDNVSLRGQSGGITFTSNTTLTDTTKIFRDSIVCGNKGELAAGVYVSMNNSDFTVDNVEICHNIGSSTGAGITFNGNGYATLRENLINKCNIHDNETTGSGGGIGNKDYNNGTIIIRDTTISGNKAEHGGGVYIDRYSDPYPMYLRLEGNTIIEKNTVTSGGGGLRVNNSNFYMEDGVEIRNNTANDTAGGLYICSDKTNDKAVPLTVEIAGGKITGNKATNSAAGFNFYSNTTKQMTLNITGGEITDNEVTLQVPPNDNMYCKGGGLYIHLANDRITPVVRISGVKISGNKVLRDGAGIYLGELINDIEISNDAEITGNIAGRYGGGIYIQSRQSDIELKDGGKLYNNKAMLGQDLYAVYKADYGGNPLNLIAAPSMFDETDGKKATAWLDESNGRTYTLPVTFIAMAKTYPFTLVYSDTDKAVAAIGDKAYSTVQEAIADAYKSGEKGKEIVLLSDVTESVSIPSGLEVKLNLNGYKLEGGGASAITNKGELEIIDDPKDVRATLVGFDEAKDYPAGEGIGTITGTAAVSGGGIFVEAGNVTLTSGQITGCKSGGNQSGATYGGGAVGIASGTFTMKGGAIFGNEARNGSAVLLQSSSAAFVMQDGVIKDNVASDNGSIFNNGGTVKIVGGTITGNKAGYGGAIYTKEGKGIVNIVGADSANPPIISNNIAVTRGGAVCADAGTVNVKDAILTGNKVTSSKSASVTDAGSLNNAAGGAIFTNTATINILDGSRITQNEAARGGAIYQYKGKVNISGGVITENVAEMGGGCAQNPLPDITNAEMVVSKKAQVYANISKLTQAGNDFYSAYEGPEEYPDFLKDRMKVPKLTLFAAETMKLPDYNAWRDDTYTGTNRVGEHIREGQFVLKLINQATNVQITAAKYNYESEIAPESLFKIEGLTIGAYDNNEIVTRGQVDGTEIFDDGTDHSKITYDDAASKEVFAKDLLESGEATLSDKTYMLNGIEFKYISYNGKLYEREQAVAWWPGDDSGEHNDIIRTFDILTYSIDAGVTFLSEKLSGTTDPDSGELGDGNEENPEENPEETENELPEYLKGYVYHVYIKGVLPCTENEAEFKITDGALKDYQITPGIINGKDVQILEGYAEYVAEKPAGTCQIPISVAVHGMKNGDTIKPYFESWIGGNDENEAAPESTEARIVTVSAAPKYNITLGYNSTLAYTGYFDLEAGTEIPETDAKLRADDPNVIHGTMLGYGVTVELYNDPSGKGIKGLELPKDGLSFDLSLKGEMYVESVLRDKSYAPYIWAYKENSRSNYEGKALNGTIYDHNMNWTDYDEINKTTHYAYDGAPFNEGDASNACYNGGGWYITGSQPTSSSDHTDIHVTINGYTFKNNNNNDNYNPSQNSDGKSSPILNSSAVKAFSAGYIQVIFPINDIDKEGVNGYIQLSLDAVASKLNIGSISGQNADTVVSASNQDDDARLQDLRAMNEYYGYEDPKQLVTDKIATNERRYSDNNYNIITALTLSGNGEGNMVSKRTYFDASDKTNINKVSPDDGKGDTPINSVVFVESVASYGSATYRTDDPEEDPAHFYLYDPMYDVDYYSQTEYNYMTGCNILQKFDAEAYTPVGTSEPIVNYDYKINDTKRNDIFEGNFDIDISEGPTAWDTNKTRNYKLTILYAAKPDGSNWIKEDVSDKYSSEPGTFDDGGAGDMEKYREENLLFFTSLDDLYAYFGGEDEGKCVGILYEFRDCCVRTGRSITTKAKMNVTGDFEKTGTTYCTTNEVKAWLTYRPHYKIMFAKNDGSLQNSIYNFTWEDSEYTKSQNGVTAYGSTLAPGVRFTEDQALNTVLTEDGRYSTGANTLRTYNSTPYIKTQYRNGVQIPGTHNSAARGNTLLLYTLDTDIKLNVTTVIPNSGGTIKRDYNITNGDREVSYEVEPSFKVSSEAKKTELVQNGSQSTNVTVDIVLPEHLSFQDGSITFDYSRCEYNDGDLQWDVEYFINDEGKKTARFKTHVSSIDMGLPRIGFTCIIGNPDDPSNDVTNGESLAITASIFADYEEYNITAAETHNDTTTIFVTMGSQDGIYKGVGTKLVEIGDDLVYILNYSNDNQLYQKRIRLGDVLPYNGDGRGTDFGGGYRVKEILIYLYQQVSYDEYFNNPANLGFLRYAKGITTTSEADLTVHQNAIIAEAEEMNSGSRFKDCTFIDTGYDDEKEAYYIRYKINEEDAVQLAEDESGIAICANFPTIDKLGDATIRVVLSPLMEDGVTRIESPNAKDERQKLQRGESVYYNNCFFRSDEVTAVTANTIDIKTVNRIVSGAVWMDQDQDGMFYSQHIADSVEEEEDKGKRLIEYPLQGIDVTLYNAKYKTDGSGEFVLDDNGNKILDKNYIYQETDIAHNILGELVEPVRTDADGKYSFEELAQGDYIVVFNNPNNDYSYIKTEADKTENNQPLPFNRLSVTTLDCKLTTNGNRSEERYKTDNDTLLDHAVLYKEINLPEKTKVQTNPYYEPNWNLGLYYIDMTMQKVWMNMVEGVPEGTQITYDLSGTVEDTELYKATCTMKQEEDSVTGTFEGHYKGYMVEERDVTIEVTDEKPTYTWKVAPNMALQAEIEAGKITYNVDESSVKDKNGNEVQNYYTVTNQQDINKFNKEEIYTVFNTQILGSVTIVKKTGSDQNLKGAEFSLYKVNSPAEADTYYAFNEGIKNKQYFEKDSTTGITAYKSNKTVDQYKINLSIDAFEALKENGAYDSINNKITVDDKEYILHKETLSDNTYQYYYYTTIKPTDKSIVYETLTVVTFDNLPLYKDGEDIEQYYTVRETGVPNGYTSLADFSILTGINLFDGYSEQAIDPETGQPEAAYIRDICFEVENTKTMALPITGGSGMSTEVIIGTMLVLLGAMYLIIDARKRRRYRGAK